MAKVRLAEEVRSEQVHSGHAIIKNIPRSLIQPVEARALSFFLSKYILGSNFGYLASFYSSCPNIEEQLSASIEAVGLASLSNELGSLELSERARKRYVHAIQATNKVLQDAAKARKDSTLIAVLLLSLYEVMTCTTRPAMCLWENHVKGAMALIQLRGRQQMQSQLGLQLLNQATASVAISSHRRKSEVPPELVTLVARALQHAPEDDPSWSFRLISMRSANLRAAIEKGSLSDPDVIIAAALELDRDFVAWSRTLPPSWQYETHFMDQDNSNLVYEARYHLYPVYGMAQGLNALRVSRLTLNELVWGQIFRHHASPLLRSQDYTTLINQVGSTITTLCSEICASVPQYVELPTVPSVSVSVCQMRSPPSDDTSDASSMPMVESSGSGFTHSARSYGIIMPLMAVAHCVIPNKPRRAWVIDRLQYISTHTKNPQASLALDVLEGKIDGGLRQVQCVLRKSNLHYC